MKNSLELSKVFEIMAFFDEARWNEENWNKNQNLINYFNENIDIETKILTHWLCYIFERQTKFEKVWEVGGFIMSEIAYRYRHEKPSEIIEFIKQYLNEKDYFVSNLKLENLNKKTRTRLERYFDKKENFVQFKSRFYPSDYKAICVTLITLKEYDYSLIKYISKTINMNEDEEIIRKVIYSLYLLTYEGIGTQTSESVKGQNFTKDLDERLKKQNKNDYKKFSQSGIFSQKRAWCAVRDFFKLVEYRNEFFNKLKDYGATENKIEKLKKPDILNQFELPGDVWNNNPIFRKCILSDTEYKTDKRQLNVILRDFCNYSTMFGYPEQFDITFDFVPRMCSKNNCNICPIDKLKRNINNDFEKVCIEAEGKYCPFLLVSCGYKKTCSPKDCILLKS